MSWVSVVSLHCHIRHLVSEIFDCFEVVFFLHMYIYMLLCL